MSRIGDIRGNSSGQVHSDSDTTPSTPVLQSGFPALAELSPPSSQGRPPVADDEIMTSANTSANVNGKRPLSTIESNGDAKGVPGLRGGDAPSGTEQPPVEVKTHESSGYSWTKVEDEPGYLWSSKRATEEANRAWDNVVLKDQRVGNRYGDPFEMADRELAITRSEQQR